MDPSLPGRTQRLTSCQRGSSFIEKLLVIGLFTLSVAGGVRTLACSAGETLGEQGVTIATMRTGTGEGAQGTDISASVAAQLSRTDVDFSQSARFDAIYGRNLPNAAASNGAPAPASSMTRSAGPGISARSAGVSESGEGGPTLGRALTASNDAPAPASSMTRSAGPGISARSAGVSESSRAGAAVPTPGRSLSLGAGAFSAASFGSGPLSIQTRMGSVASGTPPRADDDGDGIENQHDPDWTDTDTDGDGTPDRHEDDDGDFVVNELDEDSDLYDPGQQNDAIESSYPILSLTLVGGVLLAANSGSLVDVAAEVIPLPQFITRPIGNLVNSIFPNTNPVDFPGSGSNAPTPAAGSRPQPGLDNVNTGPTDLTTPTPPRPDLTEGPASGAMSTAQLVDGEVVKTINPTATGLNGEVYVLDAADRAEGAEIIGDLQNTLAADNVLGDIVPNVQVSAPGQLTMPHIDGAHLDDLSGDARVNAATQVQDAIGRAETQSGIGAGSATSEAGWTVRIDDNVANFRFDKDGNIRGWFDPIAVTPPPSRLRPDTPLSPRPPLTLIGNESDSDDNRDPFGVPGVDSSTLLGEDGPIGLGVDFVPAVPLDFGNPLSPSGLAFTPTLPLSLSPSKSSSGEPSWGDSIGPTYTTADVTTLAGEIRGDINGRFTEEDWAGFEAAGIDQIVRDEIEKTVLEEVGTALTGKTPAPKPRPSGGDGSGDEHNVELETNNPGNNSGWGNREGGEFG